MFDESLPNLCRISDEPGGAYVGESVRCDDEWQEVVVVVAVVVVVVVVIVVLSSRVTTYALHFIYRYMQKMRDCYLGYHTQNNNGHMVCGKYMILPRWELHRYLASCGSHLKVVNNTLLQFYRPSGALSAREALLVCTLSNRECLSRRQPFSVCK